MHAHIHNSTSMCVRIDAWKTGTDCCIMVTVDETNLEYFPLFEQSFQKKKLTNWR